MQRYYSLVRLKDFGPTHWKPEHKQATACGRDCKGRLKGSYFDWIDIDCKVCRAAFRKSLRGIEHGQGRA